MIDLILNMPHWGQYLIRMFFVGVAVAFFVFLGRYRPEWKSRKTIVVWTWTVVALEVVVMDGEFAESRTALAVMIIAGLLNVINLIGDRLETIKFRDFSASLVVEGKHEAKHSAKQHAEGIKNDE